MVDPSVDLYLEEWPLYIVYVLDREDPAIIVVF